jgi:hypothetical protein
MTKNDMDNDIQKCLAAIGKKYPEISAALQGVVKAVKKERPECFEALKKCCGDHLKGTPCCD